MEITTQVDDFIQSSGYENLQLIIYVMWASVLVVVIASGLSFWSNWFGMIFYPRMTFSRIAGEQQVFPNMFVALLFGLVNGAIGFIYWGNPAVRESFRAYAQNIVLPLVEQVESQISTSVVSDIIQATTTDINYAMGLLAIIPLMCLIGWFLFGTSLWVTGKTLSKNATGGLSNYLCGAAYLSWITPIFFVGYWMGFIQGSETGSLVCYIIGGILLLVYMIFPLRDYYHASWDKTVIGVLFINPLVYVILWAVFLVLAVVLYSQIMSYI